MQIVLGKWCWMAMMLWNSNGVKQMVLLCYGVRKIVLKIDVGTQQGEIKKH